MIRTRVLAVIVVLNLSATALLAQIKWYKFDRQFIQNNFSVDSAIGELDGSESHPAVNIDSVGCGGNDGELHVGIPSSAILKGNSKVLPISALASEPAGDFGVCCCTTECRPGSAR